MDKVNEFLKSWSGCGCLIIVIIISACAIVKGCMDERAKEATAHIKHVQDSIENVHKLDSIRKQRKTMDEITYVIAIEDDSLYHYYINCNKMCYVGEDVKIMLRDEAKEIGLKPCPDCMEIEDSYMEKTGDSESSEIALKIWEYIYSK